MVRCSWSCASVEDSQRSSGVAMVAESKSDRTVSGVKSRTAWTNTRVNSAGMSLERIIVVVWRLALFELFEQDIILIMLYVIVVGTGNSSVVKLDNIIEGVEQTRMDNENVADGAESLDGMSKIVECSHQHRKIVEQENNAAKSWNSYDVGSSECIHVDGVVKCCMESVEACEVVNCGLNCRVSSRLSEILELEANWIVAQVVSKRHANRIIIQDLFVLVRIRVDGNLMVDVEVRLMCRDGSKLAGRLECDSRCEVSSWNRRQSVCK